MSEFESVFIEKNEFDAKFRDISLDRERKGWRYSGKKITRGNGYLCIFTRETSPGVIRNKA